MSNESKNYAKVVYWSTEDSCYVGICPGLFAGGCHGDDQKSVFDELCVIVEENIGLIKEAGQALPEPTASVDLRLAG